MTIIDMAEYALDESWEPTTVPKDEEYEIRIISFLKDIDKRGYHYIMPFFEVTSEPRCKEFGAYMPLPNPDMMSEKELNNARRDLAAFMAAFDLGISIDMDSDVGKTGWAILGLGKDKNDEPVNKINKFVTSR